MEEAGARNGRLFAFKRSFLMATILNRANIGKPADELVAQWNAEHPENLVEE